MAVVEQGSTVDWALPLWLRSQGPYGSLGGHGASGRPLGIQGTVWSLCVGGNTPLSVSY